MKKIIMAGIAIIEVIAVIVVFNMITLAFSDINSRNKNQINSIDTANISRSSEHNGITVSIESVYGGSDVIVLTVKAESEEAVFNDDMQYNFNWWGIGSVSNPDKALKGVISYGVTIKEVDEEYWTSHIRYFNIHCSFQYNPRANYSLKDEKELVITLTDLVGDVPRGACVTAVEGEWRLKFSFDTNEIVCIDVISEPFMLYGKGLTATADLHK